MPIFFRAKRLNTNSYVQGGAGATCREVAATHKTRAPTMAHPSGESCRVSWRREERAPRDVHDIAGELLMRALQRCVDPHIDEACLGTRKVD